MDKLDELEMNKPDYCSEELDNYSGKFLKEIIEWLEEYNGILVSELNNKVLELHYLKRKCANCDKKAKFELYNRDGLPVLFCNEKCFHEWTDKGNIIRTTGILKEIKK